MKKICLVFSIIATVLVLFAATSVRAACNTQIAGWCFESNGYRVEVANPLGNPIPPSEPFPAIVSGNSVFTYKITPLDGAKSIGHVDILIPECTDSLGTPTTTCVPSCTQPSVMFYAGAGEPSIGFGLGLTTSDVLKWYFPGPGGIISLTLTDKVFAAPTAMLLKIGTSATGFPYGKILGPSCGANPQVSSTPAEPLGTKKVVNFGGVSVCLESTNQSSCPTSIYSCCTGFNLEEHCIQFSDSPCNCQSPNRKLEYSQDAFEGITPGHLRQISTIADSQCPVTCMDSESIPCTQTIVVNGVPKSTKYYTSPPCTK